MQVIRSQRSRRRRRRGPKLSRSESSFWFAVGAVIGTEMLGGGVLLGLMMLPRPEEWMSMHSLTIVTLASGLVGGFLGRWLLPRWLKIRRRHSDWNIDVGQVHSLARGNDPSVPTNIRSHNRLAH